MSNAFGLSLGPRVWIAVILPLVIICCWIRNLDDLASISMVANVCILFCLAVILYEEIYQFVSQDPEETAAIRTGKVNWGPDPVLGLALYFGSAIYAFEGIGVVSVYTELVSFPVLHKYICTLYFQPCALGFLYLI